MTDRLTEGMRGRWLVLTKTSAYHLDLSGRTARRAPQGDADGYTVAALRRDDEVYQIAVLMTCEVGKRMELMARGIADDPEVLTYRCTTPVVSITRQTDAAPEVPDEVREPDYRLPVGEDGFPLEWPHWGEQERRDYLNMIAFDAPPGYDPPRASR